MAVVDKACFGVAVLTYPFSSRLQSRSKMDDPDHIAIKARAKEMQRQEMEEIRQREANETALQAIGFPKKRQKTGPATSGGGTNSSGGPSSVGGGGSGGGTDGPFGTGGGGGGSLNNLSGGSNSNGLGLGSSSSSGLTNHSGGSGGGLGGSGGGNGAGSGSSTKPVSVHVVLANLLAMLIQPLCFLPFFPYCRQSNVSRG